MRTIKFRAQDIASNKWLYGDIRHHKNDVCIFEQGGNIGEQVKPETIGQYTGLVDRNGKEIYEGDIISSKKHPQIKHLIFYNEKQGKFMAGFNGNTNIYDFGVCGVDIPAWMAEKEVIGNIHDNPGLIEKGGEDDSTTSKNRN